MEKFPTQYINVLNVTAIKSAMQEKSGSIARFCEGLDTITYNGLIKGLNNGTIGLRSLSEILWKLPGQPSDYMATRPGQPSTTARSSEPDTPYGTTEPPKKDTHTATLIQEQNRLISHLSAELYRLRKELNQHAKNQCGKG